MNQEKEIIQLFQNLTIKTSLISITFFTALIIISFLIKKIILDKINIQKHTVFLISRILYLASISISMLFFFHISGLHVTAVASFIGVIGLAFGLASKDIVSNLLSGLFLIGDLDIKIGDFVDIEGNKGTIENIGILYTNLKSLSNNELIKIPNKALSNKSICDFSFNDPYWYPLTYVKKVDEKWDDKIKKLNEIASPVTIKNCVVIPKSIMQEYEIGIISLSLKKNHVIDFMFNYRSKILNTSGIKYIFDTSNWEEIIFNQNFISILELEKNK